MHPRPRRRARRPHRNGSTSARRLPKKRLPPLHQSAKGLPPLHQSAKRLPPLHQSAKRLPPLHQSAKGLPPLHQSAKRNLPCPHGRSGDSRRRIASPVSPTSHGTTPKNSAGKSPVSTPAAKAKPPVLTPGPQTQACTVHAWRRRRTERRQRVVLTGLPALYASHQGETCHVLARGPLTSVVHRRSRLADLIRRRERSVSAGRSSSRRWPRQACLQMRRGL
jgi:hypothetical protein